MKSQKSLLLSFVSGSQGMTYFCSISNPRKMACTQAMTGNYGLYTPEELLGYATDSFLGHLPFTV